MTEPVDLSVGFTYRDKDERRPYYGTISLWGLVVWLSPAPAEANHLAVEDARAHLLDVMRRLLASEQSDDGEVFNA